MPEVRISISDDDWDVLLWALEDPRQWVRDAVAGKINQARKRRDAEWIPRLRTEGIAIPAQNADLDAVVKGHANYKDRATREAESKPER